MKLQAEMLKIVYENENLKTIEKIEVIPRADYYESYKEDMNLGIKNNSEIFISKNHFRFINNSNRTLAVLGFKIVDENADNFVLFYTSKSNTDDFTAFKSKMLENGEKYFFDEPIIKKEKIKGKIKVKIDNALDKATVGYVNPGSFYIWVFEKCLADEEKINAAKKQKPFRCFVLPSSISVNDYKEMLNEIIDIDKNLLIADGKSKVSIGLISERKNFFKEIENLLKIIKPFLIKINKKPKSALITKNTKKTLNKIKKFTTKTMAEYTINPNKNKFLAIDYQESFDIYEHRMIKYALIKLRKLLEEVNNHNNDNTRYYLQESDEFKNKILENYFNEVELNKVGNRSAIKKLKAVCENSDFKANIGLFEIISNSKVYINDIFKINLIKKREEKYKTYIDYMYGVLRTDFIICDNKTKIAYEVVLKTNLQEFHKELYLFYINNKNDLLKFLINQIQQNCDSKLRDTIVFRDINDIFCKMMMTIKKEPEEKSVDIRSLFINTKNMINWEEFKNVIRAIDIIDEKSKKLLKEIDNLEQRKKEIITQIDILLDIPLLHKIPLKKESWKNTQIFTNDYRYNKIYKELIEFDKKYRFSKEYSIKEILHKKLDKLYEYWALIKMVYILMEKQQWELKNQVDLKNVIISVLSKNDNSNPIYNSIVLEKYIGKDITIKLQIYYDTPVDYVINRPDFRFVITVIQPKKQKETKSFYCDTKYRKYDEMGRDFGLNEDICDVAIKKYIESYKDIKDFKATASFIIHTDVNNKYTYWGGYAKEKLVDKLNVNSMSDYCSPKHRYGAFCFLPGKTDNFITFMKLIMEYHFRDLELSIFNNSKQDKLYKVICWECGEFINIEDIKEIYMRCYNGVEIYKYHMSCPNCGHFWVKNHCAVHGHTLIKHVYHNYHESEDGLWYVKCPECDDTYILY